MNTDSVNLRPGAIINTLFKPGISDTDEEAREEEESPPLDPARQKQAELWRELGDLMKVDSKLA